MKTLRSILGYSWAIVAFIVMLAMFPSLDSLENQAAKLPFMKVNPIYTGGDKASEIAKNDYLITINKPVFESLVGYPTKGFIQVKWEGNLPKAFSDTIDFDNNGSPDFVAKFTDPTQEPSISLINSNIKQLNMWGKTEKGWIIRVGIEREKK
jgi:hypothetical protein